MPRSQCERRCGVTSGSLTIQGRIIGDASQLGATFIVLPSGEVAWSHISKDASDNAEVKDVLGALTDVLG